MGKCVHDVERTDSFMMLGGMMFTGVVGTIEGAATPQVGKLALCIATFEPMEALIHGLGSFGGHGAHGETLGGYVVGGDHRTFGLRMPHFFEGGAERDSKFATIVQRGQFRFRSGGHDVFDDGG